MLKKLLASALAVATVASCAYVPSALASADTTYVTANMADYLEWSLKNPGAKDTVDISIYVSGSGVTEAGAYSMSVKPEDNTVEYVQANLAGAKLTISGTTKKYNEWNAPLTKSWEMNNSVRYVVKYAAAAGTNNYVVNVAKERAVVYHPYDGVYGATALNVADFAAVESTDADTLNGLDLKLLGYYEGDAETAVLTELTQAKYINEAKVAGYKFLYWQYNAAAPADTTASYAVPVYQAVDGTLNAIEYTKVDIVKATVSNKANQGKLTTGLYDDDQTLATDVYLPKSEAASWSLALNNYMKVKYREGVYVADITLSDDHDTTYAPTAVRQIAKATDTPTNAKYAVIYAKKGGDSRKKVNYYLKYNIVDSKITNPDLNNVPQGTDGIDKTDDALDTFINGSADYEWVTSDTEYYTTDPEEIYNKFKGNTKPATLAEYLDEIAGNDAKLVWNGTYSKIERDAADTSVTVIINVVRYNKYTVYSFGPDNSVAETTAFLSKDDVSLVSYTSKDANDKFAPASVIKASAAKLGASETATIKDVPAAYAYSNVVVPFDPGATLGADADATGVIYSTYKMGDATVEAADFATATGAFDAEAYFGRAAKAGDVVTLKVSFSDQGDAKKFELKNVTVKYDVIGATKGETFEYATKYTNDYKNGVATEFVLAEGANIITGTVTYNGKTVTLAPFYAYVG